MNEGPSWPKVIWNMRNSILGGLLVGITIRGITTAGVPVENRKRPETTEEFIALMKRCGVK